MRGADAYGRSIVGDNRPRGAAGVLYFRGITYRVKYWVPQHDREPVCRDEVLGLVDGGCVRAGRAGAPLAVSACQHAEAASQGTGLPARVVGGRWRCRSFTR